MKTYFDTNKKLWNDKVPVHLNSELYMLEAFKKGKSSLCPVVTEQLGDIKGKSILHLQCHFGQDSLQMARMGAKVTGVDFSGIAIEQARSLNEELGLNATFVEANVLELDQHHEGKYDMVFTSFGTIVWLPDLNKWASIVNHFLKPGGEFVFVEFHPTINSMDWDTAKFDYNYFNSGEPYHEMVSGTYADESSDLQGEEYFWQHSFGEIFSSLLGQGLTLKNFQEYPFSSYNVFGEMNKIEEWKYVFAKVKASFPHMFSLKMGK